MVEDEALGEKCCKMENMKCMKYVDCAPKYKQMMADAKMTKELMNEMTKRAREPLFKQCLTVVDTDCMKLLEGSCLSFFEMKCHEPGGFNA